MARVKISEFSAKKILYSALGKSYFGVSIDTTDKYYKDILSTLEEEEKYVLKVDQGVKQRNKKGLVVLGIKKEAIQENIEKLLETGYTHFIVEEMIDHESSSEYYLAIERVREGKRIHYSVKGGVNIEENKESVKTYILKSPQGYEEIAQVLGLTWEVFEGIVKAFDKYYFSFLEINPLITIGEEYYFLDAAVEVDSTAEFFVEGAWTSNEFRDGNIGNLTSEESEIKKLKEKSPASFSFDLLNPDGSLFLLLSGGGASLVTADEIYNQGKGNELANYGEYSGNPNMEETYVYTKNVLRSVLNSKAEKKAIILSGGVANFTDVRVTFKGIIKALSEVSKELKEQNVKVFVRRGGPHQDEGLSLMKSFLEKEGLMGEVHGPELVLTDIVKPAIDYV